MNVELWKWKLIVCVVTRKSEINWIPLRSSVERHFLLSRNKQAEHDDYERLESLNLFQSCWFFNSQGCANELLTIFLPANIHKAVLWIFHEANLSFKCINSALDEVTEDASVVLLCVCIFKTKNVKTMWEVPTRH